MGRFPYKSIERAVNRHVAWMACSKANTRVSCSKDILLPKGKLIPEHHSSEAISSLLFFLTHAQIMVWVCARVLAVEAASALVGLGLLSRIWS